MYLGPSVVAAVAALVLLQTTQDLDRPGVVVVAPDILDRVRPLVALVRLDKAQQEEQRQ
jgi:hypothetical protein